MSQLGSQQLCAAPRLENSSSFFFFFIYKQDYKKMVDTSAPPRSQEVLILIPAFKTTANLIASMKCMHLKGFSAHSNHSFSPQLTPFISCFPFTLHLIIFPSFSCFSSILYRAQSCSWLQAASHLSGLQCA